MSWLVIILFVSILVYLYKLFQPPPEFVKYGNLIPGPKPVPLVGNALVFLNKRRFKVMNELTQKYGPVVRLFMGKRLTVVLADGRDIEFFVASSERSTKSDIYRFFEDWLGTKNLLTSDVKIWSVHRRLLTPTFHVKILDHSVTMVERHADILCRKLGTKVGAPEFNLHDFVETCNFDILNETAMGVNLRCQEGYNMEYLDNVKVMGEIVMRRVVRPWLYPNYIFQLTSPGRVYIKKLDEILTFVRKVIMERKKMLTSGNQISTVYEDGKQKIKPFLDFLLLDSNFTDEEIENEVQLLMFAGMDTSKGCVLFTLHLLSNHPEEQEKIHNEIDDTIAEKGEDLSMHDYLNLKCLDNAIKESLRLYSPVALIGRHVTEDVTIPSGYLLPAGTNLIFDLPDLHRREDVFKDASKFIPDRFNDREGCHPYEFMPFSGGPRNCIGQKFALLEMKILLFKVLRQYKFLPAIKQTTLEMEVGLTLESKTGIPIRVAKRT